MLFTFISLGFYAAFSLGIIRSISAEIQAEMPNVIKIGLLLLGILVLLYIVKELKKIKTHHSDYKPVIRKKELLTVVAVIGGAYLTFAFNHIVGMGDVLAASLIGLIAAWTIKNYALPIYCDTFIGMVCDQIYSNPFAIGFASIITGVLYVISSHIFAGWGGKAGFLAFIGTYTTSLFINQSFHFVEPLSFRMYIYVFLTVILAGVSTFTIHTMINRVDVVSASALIGLLVAFFSSDSSHVIVFAAFCGTFTGMTSKELFTNKSDIIIASFLTAFLFVFSFSLFEGVGGKLGSLAFIASISTGGLKHLFSFLKRHPLLVRTNEYFKAKFD
ncbi:MAG: hypothetical protein L0K68_03480 [Tetragenococcus koreensis]|nr:hypothetical protein [Tetragenococcus koreensis]